jgi:hypothetical protein
VIAIAQWPCSHWCRRLQRAWSAPTSCFSPTSPLPDLVRAT